MKKIGFIDYYLDEWHANHYPDMIKEHSEGEFQVFYAYGKIDAPNGITNKEWSEKSGIPLLETIEEVVEKSDIIMVLSPDHPKMHEELAKLPLMSGKPVYIDKTFSPDKAGAVRMFDLAERHNTPCYSTSALRYSKEFEDVDKASIYRINSVGSGDYDTYSIHQYEYIVMLMNSSPKRVMALDNESHPYLIIEFADGRYAQLTQYPYADFTVTISDKDNMEKIYKIVSDYSYCFMEALVEFFRTEKIPVDHKTTIDIMAVREAGFKALKKPFEWIEV